MDILKKIDNPKETQDKKGRVYYFDNLKFILIFFVVFGHFLDPITKNSDYAKSIWLFIYSFHMPLFIFISGYFSKKSVDKKNKSRIAIFFFLYLILKMVIFGIDRFIYGKNITFHLLEEKSIAWYLFAMGAWYGISMLTNSMNKKYVFIFTIILSLVIGYDKQFGDLFCLSRIIVFYPFFLLGTMIKREQIENLNQNKIIKLASIVFLLGMICICVIFIDNIYFMRPIFTGRNSYYALKDNIENFGIFFRLLWYVISFLISISIMSLIPKGEKCFSKFGARTLAVYFLHAIVIKIFARENISLKVYQYFIVSLIVTFVFSLKWISIPFHKVMSIHLKDENKLKISWKRDI